MAKRSGSSRRRSAHVLRPVDRAKDKLRCSLTGADGARELGLAAPGPALLLLSVTRKGHESPREIEGGKASATLVKGPLARAGIGTRQRLRSWPSAL